MHLGNGAITPECIVLTAGGAAAGLSLAAAALRRNRPTGDQVLLAAGVGSLVFAAQAINIPVWPGISGHLVGGALLAWFAGPSLAVWTMAIVVALQALLLGDGGLAALGANVLNMAIVPAALVILARRWTTGERSPGLGRLGIAAALSIALAAVLIVLETAAFRPGSELAGWSEFAARMIGTHLWIGVLEAGSTVALAATLVASLSKVRERAAWRYAAACVAAALLLVVLVLPFTSNLPDGYESAAEVAGQQGLLSAEASELVQTGQLNGAAQTAQEAVIGALHTFVPGELAVMLVATLLSAGLLIIGARLWLPTASASATPNASDA